MVDIKIEVRCLQDTKEIVLKSEKTRFRTFINRRSGRRDTINCKEVYEDTVNEVFIFLDTGMKQVVDQRTVENINFEDNLLEKK